MALLLPKALVAQSQSHKNSAFVPRLQVSLGLWCVTFFNDVTPSVALMSLRRLKILFILGGNFMTLDVISGLFTAFRKSLRMEKEKRLMFVMVNTFYVVFIISLFPFGWCAMNLSSQSCMILHHGARITSTQELLHLGESVHEHKYHCMFINYIKMSLFIHCVYVQEHKIVSDWLKSAHTSIVHIHISKTVTPLWTLTTIVKCYFSSIYGYTLF